MSDYITLLGSEGVEKAGYTMRSAAENMNRAATSIDSTLERFQRYMDEYLQRFEQILKEAK